MRICVLIGFLTLCTSTIYGAGLGGISDNEKDAGPEVQEYVKNLSKTIRAGASSALASSGGNGSTDPKIFENATLTALTYKSQVVAGANYFVKVQLGDYIFHVRIFRDLQGKLIVNKVVGPKRIEDPIAYF